MRPMSPCWTSACPGLSGYDAARRIRLQKRSAPLLMIALSGWGQEDDRRKSKEAGFDHHFVKPVDIESLTNVLLEHEHRQAASVLSASPLSASR